jgi:3-oxoacyl-[acyl-carrier protein] reductase
MTERDSTPATCLVVGGSGGIGRAVVELLVASGQPVAFTYRNGLDEARRIEAASTGLARAYALDLGDREAPRRVVDTVESEMPAIAGLVNAAGIQRGQLLAMTSDAAWDELLEVNLTGAFRCCRAVLGGMVRRRRGAIVNIASLAALHGVAGLGAYTAAKAGLLGMTRALAREVGKRGVRVNAVIPGYVATEMTRELPVTAVEHLRAGECLPSGTETRGVAEAVAFLLSDRASSITGQALAVDAGASA